MTWDGVSVATMSGVRAGACPAFAHTAFSIPLRFLKLLARREIPVEGRGVPGVRSSSAAGGG